MSKILDVEIERNIIKMLLFSKDFSSSVFLYNTVNTDHFTDLFHSDVFRTIKFYFTKFGVLPDENKLKLHLANFITYDKKFKNNKSQSEIWNKGVERLFNNLNKIDSSQAESDLFSLENMRKARLIQKFIIESTNKFEEGKYTDVIDDAGNMINSSKNIDNIIMEGNIVDDFNQHVQLIKLKKSGVIKPISSGIFGAIEEDEGETYKLVELDSFIDGGFYPGELTLIIGENSVGKSFALMEIPTFSSMVNKKNTIIFTIEMNKIQQQMRIYSRITGIPFTKFRTGEINKKELRQVKDKLNEWKENCGILHIVSFDQGANVLDVENKLKDAENKYGEEFHLISIDYLNDMKPIGKYQNLKGWDAMGEISWDLAQLSKKWNNRKGIPIITANQKKTTKAGSGTTDWQDAAFSPLPVQHASVGIGISQSLTDRELGRIRFDIFKDRYGSKSISFYTFPDFSVSKISSIKKLNNYYGTQDDE